jgi:hypothetical protein
MTLHIGFIQQYNYEGNLFTLKFGKITDEEDGLYLSFEYYCELL